MRDFPPMPLNGPHRPGLPVLAWCAALLVAACGQNTGGGAGGPMPPPQVGVLTVQPGPVDLATELPGRLEAARTAQVRARVTGIVKRRLFTEGSVVRAGQSLFEIDAAPYRAALDSALATQARAEALLAQAQATLERNRPLAAAKAISQQEWVASEAAHKSAQADLAAAQAAVQQARLNVEYAAVNAPIGGLIGRALVTEGALVSQTEATLLATIQQTDRLYVNFTQSASELMRLRRSVETGQLQGGASAQVKVVLDDGSVHPQPGRLLFSDVTVDPTSGQVTLRAEVPNPKGTLMPGLFVKVRLDQARSANAILVPQQAVTRGASGDTLLVVGADGQVSQRSVRLGGSRGTDWVVLDGLKAGEQVIVDGFQKIRPKAPVAPVPWTPPSAAASGMPAASSPAGGASASVRPAPVASTAASR